MRKLNKYTYLVLALGILIAAAVIENGLLRKHPETRLIQEFQAQLIQNQKKLHSKIEAIKEELADTSFDDVQEEYFKQKQTQINQTGFGFLVYQDKKLVFWTDRAIAFFNSPGEYEKTSGLLSLNNGYYLVDTAQTGAYEIFGFHLIKNHYTFENKYLENEFSGGYSIPDNYIIDKEEQKDAYILKDADGNFLFSLWPYGTYLCTTKQLYFPGFLYLLGLVFLLLYFRREFVEAKAPFVLKLVSLALSLFVVYWLHILFEVPKVFFHLKFFGPDFFAMNYWLPSLGDYFILALFYLFWIYNFSVDLRIKDLQGHSQMPARGVIVILLLFAASIFLLVHFLVRELILNSSISFSLNKITGITFQSVLGMFSVGLLLLGTIFFTIRINHESRHYLKPKILFLLTIGVALFIALAQYVAIGEVFVWALLLFVVTLLMASLFSRKYLRTFTLSYLIIFVSLVSVYSLIVVNKTINKKEEGQQKVLAVNLVAQGDPAAEVFLTEIQREIDEDIAIQSLLMQGEDVGEYIRNSYFNTYFRKYNLNIFVCDQLDSLIIDPDETVVPCRPYLNGLIESQGIQIPGTEFYFMDNMNGRISYTGRLEYKMGLNDNDTETIFIDIDSDLLFEGIGFPELLIDKSMTHSEVYQKFTYAKYYEGELTDKYGDYNYNYNGHVYLTTDDEFSFIRQGKYEHLVYHTEGNNYIVVTRELMTFVDYLIAFPYLFVFFLLILLVILVVGRTTLREGRFLFDLKFRIQAAIISIVFVSLLVVALVTIFYNVKEYKSRHQNDLNEKMKSISEEIDQRLTNLHQISPDVGEWLGTELERLSNIFRTDINVYGTDGNLIASSRAEIYERGLISSRMNARAYHELYQNFEISYFQREQIGQLSYLSSYQPIVNDWGEYLGFVNLPYFIKQDSYSQEISTYIVAFLNLYVLLFLASIIAAVFIANQITRPLVLIQQNLQKMQLGKRNEPIQYNRKDEIGSLVREYNKKVDELAVSAELLARSERESAWREMAKQIAHEIKNPLTPMKLNIQYLQRTKPQDEEYSKYLDRVTNTLIEQIDNLSNIATEFSNFAKIPTASNQVLKVAEQLQRIIDLYMASEKAEIVFNPNDCSDVEINADKEQLSRAIINLVKNAIQSVPDSRKAEIEIDLSRRNRIVVIAISDNGSGIPVELRHKLFTPSFTTKTSGMGLGLAIVKNIVENFSGKIWFETELDEGTTFFIEIPEYNVYSINHKESKHN